MTKITIFYAIALFLLFSNCTSTSRLLYPTDKQYATKYANQLEKDSEVIKTWYHYTLEKMPDGTYIYKQYYPDTRQMTHFYTYSDEMKTLDGKNIEWYDNGNKRWEGHFINNRREGEWQEFSATDGHPTSKGLYNADLKEGKWIELDSTGTTRVSFFYKNGKKDGAFKVFDEKGELVSEGWYENDELIKREKVVGKVVTPEKKPDLVEEMPFMKSCEHEDKTIQKECSDRTLLTAIYKNIKYPTLAREMGIQGTAIIRFVVEKDGSISDVEVLRGLCHQIKATCLETMTYVPTWSPGIQDGKAVKVQFNLPIKFKLE